MFARGFHPSRVLRSVAGTELFREFCQSRAIPIGDIPPDQDGTMMVALASLPPDAQARIQLELAQVNELAGRDGNAHLLEAAGDEEIPGVEISGGPALALWFLLYQPRLFHEVFFHHEVEDVRAWRSARAAANLRIDDLSAAAAALAEELRTFFGRGTGGARFCVVEAHRLPEADWFAARVADRVQLVDGFTDTGRPAVYRVRPALAVLFSYSPDDGAVLLKSHLRATDRVCELARRFGRAVFGQELSGFGETFDLEKFKHPLALLPDAGDMELVRVKALHLCYPERYGRRSIKLETPTHDVPDAVWQMLRNHVPDASGLLVSFAEIQVRLRVAGRSKHIFIRLWPDRCSLDRTALGVRLRRCLRLWGLTHE